MVDRSFNVAWSNDILEYFFLNLQEGDEERKTATTKRCKATDQNHQVDNAVKPKVENVVTTTEDSDKKNGKIEDTKSKAVEPPKDYIHVRARRGQATDSHSLAERVHFSCIIYH
jgi:hypothetical protein